VLPGRRPATTNPLQWQHQESEGLEDMVRVVKI